MRKLAVLALALAGAIASPAMGDPVQKTTLVKDGKTVDSLFMRSAKVDGMWVLDDKNMVMLNPRRDYYLISLKEACRWIDDAKPFHFFPALGGNIMAARVYEVRDAYGRVCDVAAIREVESLAVAKEIAGK